MRIAYLVNYDISTNSGVVYKILQQTKQWSEYGHDVYIVSLKTLTMYDSKLDKITKLRPSNFKFKKIGTFLNLLFNSFYINKLITGMRFDIIYMRYQLYIPFFTKILKKNTIVMEINSDDVSEYKLNSKITYCYNLFTRNIILKNVNAFISVSNELKKRFTSFNRPVEVIANGINTDKFNCVANNNNRPIFVFIATPNQPWHGFDKILQMAEYFKDYDFNIIGYDGQNTSNLKYFGYLNMQEATEVIQKSDIGIGTLSLYKNNMFEASPLKTRQYLACGIPMIYAYEDTDIQEVKSFGLKLENSENNVDYKKIQSFVERVFNSKEIRLKARNYAVSYLDFKIKEKQRLEFFKKVLSES
ncbi:glycosyltransferase [Francisella uliginis]|uniref:Glycosyltransferase subfamily 4-like N-terminal domain-containing protein n=1 Tax=Francisella uliginis TaxID=573570 RepID=A0A1L4BTA8_9GAMM|nr:glycosyltransferase [Francisella uliginis]API87079.1 hypothetical protein F7310_06805 [Francisella uliginis]